MWRIDHPWITHHGLSFPNVCYHLRHNATIGFTAMVRKKARERKKTGNEEEGGCVGSVCTWNVNSFSYKKKKKHTQGEGEKNEQKKRTKVEK